MKYRGANFEEDPQWKGACSVRGYKGMAFHVLGWETEPDEDTEWTGQESRTGKVGVVMVGDDHVYLVDPEDITPMKRGDYCGVCGQVGCKHDGYEEEDLSNLLGESYEKQIDEDINQIFNQMIYDLLETVERGGEKFSGYNKPKRTPNHPSKSHAVLAKDGSKVRLIRFGQKGVSGAGKHPKTPKEKKRRKSFKARHAKNIKKGKMSAAYWANRVKWE